ncbi:MAG: GNAT family N-acetyltransferase [Saprospirales bacterium]|nr:GNAT family N-acetyltransferase [Saprospirales bacterium]MBK8490269.1 GNAT family N-acetyltransferase [Saprospirales bacterium]
MDATQIRRIEEYQLSPTLQQEIAGLLGRAFPGYPSGQTYFQQLPSFRFLATRAQQLVGHLAVAHRMINAGGTPAFVFGVCDLCVDPLFQHQKIGSILLDALEEEAVRFPVDFIVLVATEPEFYATKGFIPFENPSRWVSIKDHKTVGLMQQPIPGGLLVKSLTGKKWGDGVVDLLGTMF